MYIIVTILSMSCLKYYCNNTDKRVLQYAASGKGYLSCSNLASSKHTHTHTHTQTHTHTHTNAHSQTQTHTAPTTLTHTHSSLHVVEQSSISITGTSRNSLWILIHTLSGRSVIGIIFTHQIAAVLQSPGAWTGQSSGNHDD